MPVATSNQFLETLRKSGLIEDSVLDSVLSNYSGTTEDPTKIAEFLISRKLITSFQAKSLLAGRYKGLVIGAYRVMEKIGSGGMGVVYLAEHEKLKRRVAIKILPEDKTRDKLALERFYREARAAAALDHPNIVKAFDVSEHNGLHYLVMEYIDGTNLQKFLDVKGPLPWKTALNIVIQSCKGLQHAHERNMVHRDIKPANILVDKSGQVKILDLGLARSFQVVQDNLTQDLSDGKDVMGSIDYIAPEQAIANNAVDIRADIYSLGATLFALITGKSPVEGTTAQKLLQHQMQMPPALNRLRPEVPETVAQVVAKMLAKRPEHRFTTPNEVIAALTPFVASNSQQLPSISSTQLSSPSLSGPISGGLFRATTGSLIPTAPITGGSGALSSQSTKIEAKGTTSRLKKESASKKIKLDRKVSPKVLILVGCLAAILVPALTYYFISASEVKKDNKIDPSLTTVLKGDKFTAGPGNKMPDVKFEDMSGVHFSINDYKGKIVLLQFSGFTCPHSCKLYPDQKKLAEKYKTRPFAVLNVNTDRTKEEFEEGQKDYNLPFRHLKQVTSDKTRLTTALGVKVSPTLLLIDATGSIRRIWEGPPPSWREVESLIDYYVMAVEASANTGK